MSDRRTKQQLEAAITAHEAQIVKLEAERDAWRKVAPSDLEAAAIARCVVGLDGIPKTSTSSYSSGMRSDSFAIERVLRYLASRYGVTL